MNNKTIVGTALAGFIFASPALAAEQDRGLDGFTRIDTKSFIDVEVTVGPSFSVTAFADDDLLQYVTTEVDGSTLKISTKRKSWRYFEDRQDQVKVVVTMPALDAMRISGSGDAYVTGLDSEDFRFQTRGSGDLEIEGTCGSGDFNVRGSGDIDGSELTCESLDISIQGSGDVKMASQAQVEVGIRGSGNVNLWGTCTKGEFSIGGSGDIDARDLVCETADLSIHGSGDIELTVNGDVDVDLKGNGDVELYGDASLRKLNMRGSGSLEIKDND